MTPKTDHLIQYALLISAEADDAFRRGLGPIHLIKYVYLADLAFAARNQGETYTGTRWIFHNFGPWSNDVNNRIKPAVDEIEGEKKVYSGKVSGKEATRFEAAPDEVLAGKLEQLIPAGDCGDAFTGRGGVLCAAVRPRRSIGGSRERGLEQNMKS